MGTPMAYCDLLDADKNFAGVLASIDHFPRNSGVRFNIFPSQIRKQMCLLVERSFQRCPQPFFYEQY